MADEKNPFAEELSRRENANPFDSELRKRERDSMSGADTLLDVGEHLVRGFNKGWATLATAPYTIPDWIGEKVTGGDFLPNIEDTAFWGQFLKQPEAKSKPGEYAQKVGEVLGSSVIPEAALLNRGRQMGAAAIPAAPQSTRQAITQTIVEPYATSPGRALAADTVAGTAAGIGEKAAEDAGFGSTGQMISGLGAATLPFLAKSAYNIPAGYLREARSRATPHAKVAEHLGEDFDLDALAVQTGVGSTGNAPTAQHQQTLLRIMDTLGEEMIRNGGDARVAIDAAVTRVAQDLNMTEPTVREWIRRMTAAQYDNPLLLGEYPSVMASNQATRTRDTGTILNEMQRAENERNPLAAAQIRRQADPGRIEDTNTQWMLDTMANSGGGEGSTTVRRAIDDRLDNLGNMARHRVQDWSPNGQTTQDVEVALENMRQLANADYRNVYRNPNGTPVNYSMLHGLLPRVVDRNINRMGGYNAEQADALRQAINHLYATRPAGVAARQALPGLEDQLSQLRMQIREARRQRMPRDQIDDMSRQADQLAEQLRLERRDASPPTQQHLLLTLEQLQNSRSAIRGMLDGYRADPSKRHLLPVVEPLYRDITRLMQRASPEWARANQRWADMELDRVARELGQNLTDKPGPQYRQQIQEFNRLAPQAQDFVRIEFAQQFMDAIRGAGRGDNVAKFFNTPHIRDMVRTILGDDAAVDMMRLARDLNVATKSKNMMHGSPTAPRQQREKRLNSDLNLIAESDIPTSLDQFFDKLKKYTVGKMIDRRNAGIANILTTPVRDIPAMAEQIARMRLAQETAARYAGPARLREALRAGRANAIRTVPGAAGAAYDHDE